jgi:predicted metalloprotease with PDZ domain
MARTRKSPTAAGDDKVTGRTRSRKSSVRAAESRDAVERDLLQQCQYLDEMARQFKALMQDMRETQQRVLVESADRTWGTEDQLAGCKRELAAMRQYLQALPAEIREIILVQPEPPNALPGIKETAEEKERTAEVVPEVPAARGWLGVTVEPAVIVAEVLPGTPAEAAGLVRGDVIIGVNSVRVLDAVELQQLVHQEAGEEITLQLGRGEEKRVVRVILDTPVPDNSEANS